MVRDFEAISDCGESPYRRGSVAIVATESASEGALAYAGRTKLNDISNERHGGISDSCPPPTH